MLEVLSVLENLELGNMKTVSDRSTDSAYFTTGKTKFIEDHGFVLKNETITSIKF